MEDGHEAVITELYPRGLIGNNTVWNACAATGKIAPKGATNTGATDQLQPTCPRAPNTNTSWTNILVPADYTHPEDATFLLGAYRFLPVDTPSAVDIILLTTVPGETSHTLTDVVEYLAHEFSATVYAIDHRGSYTLQRGEQFFDLITNPLGTASQVPFPLGTLTIQNAALDVVMLARGVHQPERKLILFGTAYGALLAHQTLKVAPNLFDVALLHSLPPLHGTPPEDLFGIAIHCATHEQCAKNFFSDHHSSPNLSRTHMATNIYKDMLGGLRNILGNSNQCAKSFNELIKLERSSASGTAAKFLSLTRHLTPLILGSEEALKSLPAKQKYSQLLLLLLKSINDCAYPQRFALEVLPLFKDYFSPSDDEKLPCALKKSLANSTFAKLDNDSVAKGSGGVAFFSKANWEEAKQHAEAPESQPHPEPKSSSTGPHFNELVHTMIRLDASLFDFRRPIGNNEIAAPTVGDPAAYIQYTYLEAFWDAFEDVLGGMRFTDTTPVCTKKTTVLMAHGMLDLTTPALTAWRAYHAIQAPRKQWFMSTHHGHDYLFSDCFTQWLAHAADITSRTPHVAFGIKECIEQLDKQEELDWSLKETHFAPLWNHIASRPLDKNNGNTNLPQKFEIPPTFASNSSAAMVPLEGSGPVKPSVRGKVAPHAGSHVPFALHNQGHGSKYDQMAGSKQADSQRFNFLYVAALGGLVAVVFLVIIWFKFFRPKLRTTV